jgi:squalene-hopene/tetraprenyl-beta-curcumene cyclase
MSPTVQAKDSLVRAIPAAVERAAENLLAQQHARGYWNAELTADSTLESDYILLQLWMYPPEDGVWNPPSMPLVRKAAESIFARQLSDGGFNIYPQGPTEVSATVKAYCALKLAGIPADDPRLSQARQCILALGGLQAANSYVKINLSLFGLYPREHCPTIPPELMLLPGNFIHQMSSWTRAIVIALSVVHAHNPQRPVPAGFSLDELLLPGASLGFRRDPQLITWRNTFLQIDRLLKFWERYGPDSVRRKAIGRAEQWMLQRFEHSDGLGAIYPPMMYAIMALDSLGYPEDHPVRRRAVEEFDALMVDDGRPLFFQPCFSPVWDTGIAMFALAESGYAPGPALTRAADWLLEKEIRRKGDWSVKLPHTEPSGWAFEFDNAFYPDVDDTAMVLLGLARGHASNRQAQQECHERALRWMLDMQGSDGGWAAFDKDNNWQFLSHVPFADHNAMLDPTCADITGRVLEALGAHGLERDHPAVSRAVDYLVRTQQPDGSWYGRWGVAYIYGTCFALRGLRAAGEDDREVHVLRAGEWLRSIQNADGGWGESCASYDNATFTAAPSTPSQTAWAILGLIAGGDTTSRSLLHGVEYLIESQRRDGSWNEDLATGTGFPKVFYLTYHLYRLYFPLLALSEFARTQRSRSTEQP